MADDPSRSVYQFEGFRLDLGRGRLLDADGAEVALRHKAFNLLRHLAENADRIVSREELLAAVWPGVFVNDDSVTQCALEVRRALGDEDQKLLRTVPKKGYILAAAVASDGSSQLSSLERSPQRQGLGDEVFGNSILRGTDGFAGGLARGKGPQPNHREWRADRKLAAILAADVAGYSRLIEADEEGTLAALGAHRALVDPQIKEHRGRT